MNANTYGIARGLKPAYVRTISTHIRTYGESDRNQDLVFVTKSFGGVKSISVVLFLLANVSSSRNASSSPVALAHSVDLASLAVFASAGSSGVLCTAAPNVPLVNVAACGL